MTKVTNVKSNETLMESKAAFARRLGVSDSYISQVSKRDGFPLADDGSVLVMPALEFMKTEISSGRPGRKAGSLVGGGDSADLVAARVQLLHIQIEKASLELEAMRGETIPKRDAIRAVRAYSRVFRDYLLRAGDRWASFVASELPVPVPVPAVARAIDRLMHAALTEVSSTPAPDFFDDPDDKSFPMSETAIKDAINDKDK